MLLTSNYIVIQSAIMFFLKKLVFKVFYIFILIFQFLFKFRELLSQ